MSRTPSRSSAVRESGQRLGQLGRARSRLRQPRSPTSGRPCILRTPPRPPRCIPVAAGARLEALRRVGGGSRGCPARLFVIERLADSGRRGAVWESTSNNTRAIHGGDRLRATDRRRDSASRLVPPAGSPPTPATRSMRVPSSSIKPSALRGCVRAPLREPRATRGTRRPARPGAAPTRSPATSPRLGRSPRPRHRDRCLTASRGGRCRPGTRPRPGVAHAQVAAIEGVLHHEETRRFPGRQLRQIEPVRRGRFLSRMKFIDEPGEGASPTLSALRAYREHRAARDRPERIERV